MIEPQPSPITPISAHIGGWLFMKGMQIIARPVNTRQVAWSRTGPYLAASGAIEKAVTKAIAL